MSGMKRSKDDLKTQAKIKSGRRSKDGQADNNGNACPTFITNCDVIDVQIGDANDNVDIANDVVDGRKGMKFLKLKGKQKRRSSSKDSLNYSCSSLFTNA